MGKQLQKYLPDKNYFIKKTVPGKKDYQITDYIKSGGNAHVFKAYSKTMSHTCACKIIPKKNLIGINLEQPAWEEEFRKANILAHRSVVKFFHVDI